MMKWNDYNKTKPTYDDSLTGSNRYLIANDDNCIFYGYLDKGDIFRIYTHTNGLMKYHGSIKTWCNVEGLDDNTTATLDQDTYDKELNAIGIMLGALSQVNKVEDKLHCLEYVKGRVLK